MSGVIRGCGHQLWGAGINFIAFYIVGLPIGIPLALFTSLKSFGMWIGLLCASLTQVIGYSIILLCLNWKKESLLAMKRGEGEKGKKERGGHHGNEDEEEERIELQDYRPVTLEEVEFDEERNENGIEENENEIEENENEIEENENEDEDNKELLTDKLLEDDDEDKKQEDVTEVTLHKSTKKSKKMKIIKILLTKGVLYLIGIIGCGVAIFTSRFTPPESFINGNFSECTDNYYLYHNATH